MPRFDLSKSIPVLLLGDSPDGHTGLSRVCHDLAWLLSRMPEFKVGVLGRAGLGRSYFPWASYQFSAQEQYGESRLEEAWGDLSQGARGIVLTVWDASRLMWLADPLGMPDSLQKLLGSGAIERWGYFMTDSEGVNAGHLPLTTAYTMSKYERLLVASKWALNVSKRSLPDHPDLDWCPHMLNTDVFSPVDRMYARSNFGVSEREVLVGAVMANQQRKYWPLVFEALSLMRSTTAGKPKLWVHTDIAAPKPGWGVWNLQALAHEYGVEDRVLIDTRPLADKEMAMCYSACDATMLISGAEGFAYPIVESLACGVPVVSGNYAAGAELCSHAVQATGYRIETQFNVRWATYAAPQIAAGLEQATDEVRSGDWEASWGQAQTEHLSGKKLGKVFHKWFRKGLQ